MKKNQTNGFLERVIVYCDIFKEPTSIKFAAKKAGDSSRTVYRVIERLEDNGFKFVRTGATQYRKYHLVDIPEPLKEIVKWRS